MRTTTKQWMGGLSLVFLGVLSGCGSDDGSDNGGAATGGAGGSAGAAGAAGAAAGVEVAALVRGTLAQSDMGQAQAQHDAIAKGGEAAAKAAGDIGHDVGLGTTLLGTTENAFLGLDRWKPGSDPAAFYSNPDFQKAFGSLFASPPKLELFAKQDSWHSWGSIDAADGVDPHYYVVVRGRLAKDPAATRPAHDQLAQGGEAQAKAAGDVAHVVYLGVEDPLEFLAIDLWTTKDAMAGVYGDPGFQKAFGALFASPPTLGVYQSTSFHQW